MRILQVVTWVGPGNPFGGPVSVARNQAAELRRQGHEVHVVSAQPSLRRRGTWTTDGLSIEAFTAYRLIPGAGFSGVFSPRLLRYLKREIPRFDVVHVHLARDLVTLPAALLARAAEIPYVVQSHGMVDASTKLLARILDAVATRRVLRDAKVLLSLTSREDNDLRDVVPGVDLRIERLENGITVPALPTLGPGDSLEVVFCSRLHERKRPAMFAASAADLAEEGTAATFVLVGPDEGEGSAVTQIANRSAVSREKVTWVGPAEPETVQRRLGSAAMLVLPSVNEPYPMVVLEAMALGRPVIITSECGLAPLVEREDCGVVIPPDDPLALTSAVRRLINDPAMRTSMGERARCAVIRDSNIAEVVTRLLAAYHGPTAEERRV